MLCLLILDDVVVECMSLLLLLLINILEENMRIRNFCAHITYLLLTHLHTHTHICTIHIYILICMCI